MTDEVTDPGPPRRRSSSERRAALLSVGLTVAVVVVALAGVLRLWKADLSTPFTYSEDANSHALLVKAVDDFGWYEHNPEVGAPFGLTFHDFPMADNFQLLVTKVIGWATDDYAVVFNLYYLATYVLVALAALWAFRRMRLSRPAAVVLAVLYAFLPYHFMRGATGHLFLVGYYVVPLGAWLAYAVLAGEPLLTRHGTRRGAARFLTIENVRTVGFAVLIGATSGYYAFFTAVVVAGAAVVRLARRAQPRTVAAAAVVLVSIAASQLANLAPDLAHRRAHGDNPAVARRAAGESEFYSLKLAQLVLPMPYHRIDRLAAMRKDYGGTFPLPSEGAQVSLGAVGAVGLLWLLAVSVLRPGPGRRRSGHRADAADPEPAPAADADPRSGALATLTLFTFLVATVGGLSTFVALFVTTQVRAWNRMSVFLAFFALAGVGVLLDRLTARIAQGRRRALAYVLPGLVLVAGLADQTSDAFVPDYPGIRAEFTSDRDFVRSIETSLPDGSMVFQLPVVPFPEWPPVHRMTDYSHLKGYLHSESLRWSYGGMKGRESDWQLSLDDRPTAEVLVAITAAGFRGLYIDRFGFEDGGARVEQETAALTGSSPLTSRNGRLTFFDLRQYATRLGTELGSEELRQLESVVLHPTRLAYGDGFFHQEGDATVSWRWARARAVLILDNPSARVRRVRLALSFATGSQTPASVALTFPDGITRRIPVSAQRARFAHEIELAPGETEVILETDAPRAGAGADERDIRLQVIDARVVDLVRERHAAAAST